MPIVSGGELSLAALGESVRARPQDPGAWLSYALALHRAGDADRSVQCIRHAAALGREDSIVLTRVGEAFERVGAYGDALAAGRYATRLPDPPPEAAALVGRMLTRMGDGAAAALTLRVAIARFPNSAPLRVALGQALLASNRAAEAVEHAQRAIALAGHSPAAHRLNAELQEKLGNRDEYMAALGRVAELDHSDVSAAIALGAQKARQGERESAIELLSNAATRQPKTAAGQLALGTGFLEARALTAAVRHLKEAIRLQPDLAPAHLQLGIAFREAGSLPDAVAALRKATLLASENPEYHHQLGLALLEANQAREAANVLIRAAAFDPEDENIQDALALALTRTRTRKRGPGEGPADATVTSEPDDDDSANEGTFTGDLKLFSVAELLDFLLNQRATGTLIVRGPKGDGRVELYQGSIVGARHPGSKPLSRQLLDTDMISDTDLKRTVVDPDDLERDGVVASVLAARNLVDKTSLEELIRRHVQEALFEMLTWQHGDAVFRREASDAAYPEAPEILLDTRWLLIDATRRIDEHRTRSGRAPS